MSQFFVDQHTLSGEWYLIPAEHRSAWDTFDKACEETSELLPPPPWAPHLRDGVRWLHFERPEEVLQQPSRADVETEYDDMSGPEICDRCDGDGVIDLDDCGTEMVCGRCKGAGEI